MSTLIDQLEAAHKKARDFSDAVQDEINRKTGFCFYCTLHTHYDETRFSIHHCEAKTNDPNEEGFDQYTSYSCEAISTLYKLDLPRKELGGKRVYDKADLDEYADSLPYEGQKEGNSCDAMFGLGASN